MNIYILGAEAAETEPPQTSPAPPGAGMGASLVDGAGDVTLTPRDLPIALSELSRATERAYYDDEADRAAASTYYAGIGTTATGVPTVEALRELIRATHSDPRGYRPAIEVYPWVDLRVSLKLASIYSGRDFDAAEVILEDFKREAARERAISFEGVDPLAAEAAFPYNCEHVVPQSWFGEREPMRGDLHHLFCCEWGCNSFRGNFRYHAFDPSIEVVRNECGRREVEGFEPSFGKGPVARASLYVWLRYPEDVDWARTGDLAEWIRTMQAWHEGDPPADYERHRTRRSWSGRGTGTRSSITPSG